ncbi:hypothetical protein [Roseospirillum parvum]|uniref:Uncharacterized protein n=1 Tax=Roseospirillum parvum TaxID=83401 RepID=A0A1G7W7F4_9PROT|nr:hypothetical protein [Roseospirillum parvum]SDG67924.1 hypothetical protein SAMN05421742_102104 [Roseospirillum parvum]
MGGDAAALMAAAGLAPPWRRALVVFTDSRRVWWLRGLRPGFRHCLVILESARTCVVLDPLLQGVEVRLLPSPGLPELLVRLKAEGATVVSCRPCRPMPRMVPPRPFTCVELVKRVLGMRAPWVLTPWQLHCRIRSLEKEKNLLTRRSSGCT